MAIKQPRLSSSPQSRCRDSQRACGNASSKLAWLCPAAQAEPIHQLSCRLPVRVSAELALSAGLEASNTGQQGWGLGEALGGTVCATVMDDANRDSIPESFLPFRTSGKFLNQSSCRAPIAQALSFFRETPVQTTVIPVEGLGACAKKRFLDVCYFLEAETRGAFTKHKPTRGSWASRKANQTWN